MAEGWGAGPAVTMAVEEPVTYLLIDGENLDATLGVSVLGHRPAPEERPLDAIAGRVGNAMLASHDGDFLQQVQALLGGDRQVGILAFREFLNTGYGELVPAGLQVFDLEDDAKCFNRVLPRLRIIDIESFDPADFL